MSEYQIQVSEDFDGGWQWRVRKLNPEEGWVVVEEHGARCATRSEAVRHARAVIKRCTFVNVWETIDND